MRILVVSILRSAFFTGGWGPRGHQSPNHAAIQTIPPDGPVFLSEFEDWIAKIGHIPDSWRGASEPYSKLFEDTAWLDSAERTTSGNPASLSNPKYNRATGTAPPEGAPRSPIGPTDRR